MNPVNPIAGIPAVTTRAICHPLIYAIINPAIRVANTFKNCPTFYPIAPWNEIVYVENLEDNCV